MRIVISDDHLEFRQGLKTLLERLGFDIVGEAADGWDALQLIDIQNPDIAILEMNSLRLNAFEISREILVRGLKTKVIMLSMFKDETSVLESFRAGINAFVLKTHSAHDIVLAIHQLERSKNFMSPAITDLIVESYHPPQPRKSSLLTVTETDIVRMLAQDTPKDVIARQLKITVECLEGQRKFIMEKLHASNIGGIVRHAVRAGIIRA